MSRRRPSEAHAFPTTQWPLVRRGKAALGEIFQIYRPVLHAYLTGVQRVRHEDAEDIVQSFVTTQMCVKDLIGTADETKGRFRTLLVTALNRYYYNWLRDRQTTTNMPPSGPPASLEGCGEVSATSCETDAFDIAWARELLNETLRLIRERCEIRNRPDIWGVFEGRLLRPALEQVPPVGYDELCKRFGMKSPTKTACLLATAKRIGSRMLQIAVSRYLTRDESIKDEITELIRILGSATHHEGDDGE